MALTQVALRRGFAAAAPPPAAFLPVAEVTNRVFTVVHSLKYSPESVASNAHFINDLDFDSLIHADLVEKLGGEFCVDVPSKDAKNMMSVQAAVDFFAAHPKAR